MASFNAGGQSNQHAFHPQQSSFQSSRREQPSQGAPPQFDILEWYPQFQSCHRYFLDHAQHSGAVQALAAFMNIQLPYQKQPFPVMSSSTSSPHAVPAPSGMSSSMRQPPPNPFSTQQNMGHPQSVSLIPYIRRLIATGHDRPQILHGFFGDNWNEGIGKLHEIERRNYLFAAKSTGWLKVKAAYDMSPEETCPFLLPLKGATEDEIQAADNAWSEWLAMQDWMLGPRAPENMGESAPRIKREME